MNKWTKIDTEIDRHLMLGSPRLLEMPFVYVSTEESFELSPTEKANVKKYLENGGFMVLENPLPKEEMNPAEASLKQMIRDALGSGAVRPHPEGSSDLHLFLRFHRWSSDRRRNRTLLDMRSLPVDLSNPREAGWGNHVYAAPAVIQQARALP